MNTNDVLAGIVFAVSLAICIGLYLLGRRLRRDELKSLGALTWIAGWVVSAYMAGEITHRAMVGDIALIILAALFIAWVSFQYY